MTMSTNRAERRSADPALAGPCSTRWALGKKATCSRASIVGGDPPAPAMAERAGCVILNKGASVDDAVTVLAGRYSAWSSSSDR
jgi:hypothetical protein